ncbi:MAG: hypothetical protein RR123_02180 [Clostridia bacterium]
MKDLRSYIKNQNIDKSQVPKEVQNQVDYYSGMSQDRLVKEFYKMAEEEKRKGTLNQQQVDAFYKNIAPMLTPEQQNKLKSLLKTI